MKDYLMYIDAVKQVLARRDVIQAEHDMCGEELQKKTAEKEQVRFLFYQWPAHVGIFRSVVSSVLAQKSTFVSF